MEAVRLKSPIHPCVCGGLSMACDCMVRYTGVDDRLARHIAHLWIRDPLVVFSERVHVDDATTSEHFEVRKHSAWLHI